MKTSFFSILIATLLWSCGGNNPEQKTEAENHDHANNEHGNEMHYTCPMHPEVMEHGPGQCPKCGMDLVVKNDAADSKEYFIRFASNPAEVEAGKAGKITLTPKIKTDESKLVILDVMHEKKMHLIVVSKDLSEFHHVHPVEQTDGSFELLLLDAGTPFSKGDNANELKLEHGGDYHFYVDYVPYGSTHRTEKIDVTVAGKSLPAKTFGTEKLKTTVNGYEVELEPEGGLFYNQGETHINVIIKKGGKEIPDSQLDSYLSAKAHVVMIETTDKTYMHIHPESENNRVHLHADFGKEGIHRAWVQFMHKGKLHVADFLVKVSNALSPAPPKTAENESHGHAH
ncbi:MAG: heavy metal-binding domain-containing protein [Flavobacteriales bacterium]|nr:heavy metal-binding domain-containing protein [Flavobacteriales bacterium]